MNENVGGRITSRDARRAVEAREAAAAGVSLPPTDIDPEKLDYIAEHLDITDHLWIEFSKTLPGHEEGKEAFKGKEMQADLRRWAAAIRDQRAAGVSLGPSADERLAKYVHLADDLADENEQLEALVRRFVSWSAQQPGRGPLGAIVADAREVLARAALGDTPLPKGTMVTCDYADRPHVFDEDERQCRNPVAVSLGDTPEPREVFCDECGRDLTNDPRGHRLDCPIGESAAALAAALRDYESWAGDADWIPMAIRNNATAALVRWESRSSGDST
ncbi:MAG TPA: hypothetical protein VLE97_07975 [Gaiellaceae bacterium]|nr:hypothetical protein [Gaiellaceae bacterium]